MDLPVSFEPIALADEDLKSLMLELDTCPLKNSGVRVVMPVGDGSSKIMFIGEAPGAKEDIQGEPFVGASGKLLNNVLLPSIGLSRQNIYLTNIVKCRPPENRDPTEEEKQAWSPVLLAEIISKKPHVIVCLGRHSLSFFLPLAKIGQVHGIIQEVQLTPTITQKVMPLYHPAVALYNPGMRIVLQEDFLKLKEYVSADIVTPDPREIL